ADPPVEVSFGALRFEMDMLERATPFEFVAGYVLLTCSAEDLFVMKAFAGRPQDWLDIRGIAVKQGGTLNKRYILKHLTELCALKETPEIVDQARRLLEGKR
ncbi:MAG: hypothetical protein NTV49_03500, partial [Kiritimatiellaeota bacterium]|nr:hypothetical protein [Kiritimatiellota bacterium]